MQAGRPHSAVDGPGRHKYRTPEFPPSFPDASQMTLPSPPPIVQSASKRKQLPAGTKLLFVTTLARRVGWLEAALATEVGSEIEVSEALGGPDGLARLRDEVFDAVLMQHEPPTLDALKLVAGLRTGGFGDPVVVVGEGDWAEACHVAGANGYCDLSQTTSPSLAWVCHWRMVSAVM